MIHYFISRLKSDKSFIFRVIYFINLNPKAHKNVSGFMFYYIISVSENLPVSNFRYFGKNIKYSSMATFNFFFLANDRLVFRDKTVPRALELG